MPINLIDINSKTVKEEIQEQRDKNNSNTVISIKTKYGWRSIDSPYDPSGEAHSAVGQDDLDRFSKVIVLGAGSGFIASELVKTGVTDITLITGSRALAQRNVETLAGYNDCESNIDIIVSSSVNDQLFEYIKNRSSDKRRLKIIYHPREIKVFPSLFNPLSVYIQTLLFPVNNYAAKPPKRVLFPNAGQLLEPEILRELESRGIDVISVQSYADKKINPSEAWKSIRQFAPDLVLSTNNKGSDPDGLIPEACAFADVPWVTWFIDEPGFIVAREEIRKHQKRYGFCWDIAGIDACRDLGFSNLTLLPLATDPSHFTPGEGIENLTGRIVYVGSPSFGNEKKYFSSIYSDPKADLLAKTIEDSLTQKRTLPSQQEIYDTIENLGIKKNCFSSETLRRLPAFILYKANLSYRVGALTALAPLKPVVYGDGWAGLLPDTVEIRNYVDYYGDLVNVYRSDAVHLSLTHLQMRLYPNQRIFDVGACGRIVVGDRLKGWNDLFGNAFDELIFNNFEDLYEKAELLAENPGKRKHLGRNLRKLVLEQHTIAKRIDTIFNELETI